jgi:hypothetical protein
VRRNPRKSLRASSAVAKALGALLGVTLLVLGASCTGRPPGTELQIRLGQTYATTVNGVKVFVADKDGRAVVFVNSAQHLPGEQVWWCADEKVFLSPSPGELFDADGRYLAGPASRDLDRVTVVDQTDGQLTIDLTRIERGDTRAEPDTFTGLSPDVKTRYREWATRKQGEPSTFCRNHIAG